MINNTCNSCPEGTYYNYKLLKCSSLCGDNAAYQNGRCYCLKGFYVINGVCSTCPNGYRFDTNLRKCISNCHPTQILVG